MEHTHRPCNLPRSHRQQGFSLIEILLALAVMTILALGSAELFRMNLFSQQTVAKGFQMENLHEEIRVFLSKEIDCTATFGGLNPTSTVDIPKLMKAGAPPTASPYVTGALLGDRQVKLKKMTMNGTKYVASSTPFSGEVPLEVQYEKNGSVIGSSEFMRTVLLEVKLDPAGSGLIVSCVSKAKMTDGLWRQTLVSPPGQTNIFYNAGTVAVGTTTPNDGVNMHIHNETTQGTLIVSGVSDFGATWSALYLGDGGANNKALASNDWVMAFKKDAPAGTDPNRFEVNYQKRAAGTWGIGGGETNAMALMAPNPPLTPWARATIGAQGSDPNVMLQVFNKFHQGELSIGGVGEAAGGNNTWSALYLTDQNGPDKTAASKGWVMAYKKSAGFANQEDLEFNYFTRAAGSYAMTSNKSSLVLKPAAGAALYGKVGVAVGDPATTLDVGGDTTIRGLLHVTGVSNFDSNITVNGTVTATSDSRLKTDIKPLPADTIAKLEKLQGVSYLRKDQASSGKREIGFIAQEVEKLFPEFVETNPSGFKSVNYSQMTAVLAEGIKDLDKKNGQCLMEQTSMKAELQKLAQENKDIKKQMGEMKLLLEQLQKKMKVN